MLSAWFDKELSEAEMAEVEAYIQQSDEAKQIVAGYRAVKKLAQTSEASQADYWERSANRIEAAIDSASESKILPVRRSGWSNWTVKALSIAASISILTFIGLNQTEIIESMSHKQTIPEVQENAPIIELTADSIERQEADGENESNSDYKSAEDDSQIDSDRSDTQENIKPDEMAEVVSPEEADKVTKQVVSELDEIAVRGGRAGEINYIIDSVEVADQTIEREAAIVKTESDLSKPAAPVINRSAATKPIGTTELGNTITLTGEDVSNKSVTRAPESLVAEQDQIYKRKRSIEKPTALAESIDTDSDELITGDEILEVDRSEIRYRQLWERDILARLTTIEQVGRLDRDSKATWYDAEGNSIAQGLAAAEERAKAKGKSEGKYRSRSASKSDSAKIADERELLEAASYIGSNNIYDKEYDQAVTYLRWMAKENKATLNRKHAKKLLNELLDLKED